MSPIKEIADPGAPTIEELRESQRAGATGTGTDKRYAEKMAANNHGTGLGEGSDEKFPIAADYKDSAVDGGLPWE